jgi:hypothetical protein
MVVALRSSCRVRRRLLSAFEIEANRLGLTRETYASSDQLRVWCEANRNHCYIPEWLIKQWKIPVDPYVSVTRSRCAKLAITGDEVPAYPLSLPLPQIRGLELSYRITQAQFPQDSLAQRA